MQQASYGAALIEQTTETDTPLPGIFQLMTGLLSHLSAHPPQPLTIFAFEMKLLGNLGLTPELSQARICAGTKVILQRLLELNWPGLSRLKLSEAQTAEIRQFLNGFLILHLGKVPKGRPSAAD